MKDSFEYFKRQDTEQVLKQIWEIRPPNLATVQLGDYGQDPSGTGIYTLSYLKKILNDWHGHDAYRAIPEPSERPIIDRSIEYWNARGHQFSRPQGAAGGLQ